MIPSDLAQPLQTVFLALAVGCGSPALIYLLLKGSKPSENPAGKMESLQPTIQPSKELGDVRQLVPVLVKGYVYVSRSFLELTVKTPHPTAQPEQARPLGTAKQPGAKPLIRRVGE